MSLFLRKILRIQPRRYINTSLFVRNEDKLTKQTENAVADLRIGGKNHKVDNLEKRILVWTGKYKTINEVPAHVTQETMERARNRARIKIANYMMLATALACIAMIISGRRAARRGESVQKMNLDWHKAVKEGEEE